LKGIFSDETEKGFYKIKKAIAVKGDQTVKKNHQDDKKKGQQHGKGYLKAGIIRLYKGACMKEGTKGGNQIRKAQIK